jgi:RHS repeat-associated protein
MNPETRHLARTGRRTLVAATLLAAATASPLHAARPVAGAVTPERLKLPAGPGSVRGLADAPTIDPAGARVDHQVPIEVPVGRGGLAPALALVYSGALGNGPLGIGWALSEVRVERSTRLGVPRFDDTDELELVGLANGGRLVAIGNGEYRVEGQGQTIRVRRVGAGFEVDDGTGVSYRLGTTAAARHEGALGSGAVRTQAWLVESQHNDAGEQVRYTYLRDGGTLYLQGVVWGAADRYAVDLAYEARADVTTSYRDGFRAVTALRLARVRVRVGSEERRAYQLAYDDAFPVARLTGVTSSGRAGAGAWPALAFEYAAASPPVVTPVEGIGTWRLNTAGTTLVDLDGDGAAELLQLADGSHAYLSNQRGVFGGAQALSGNALSITQLQLQDLDGDARAELVRDTGNGWEVWKWSRTRWLPQGAGLPGGVWPGTVGIALKQPTLTRFADLDGNGLPDAIRWSNDHLEIRFASRTGYGTPSAVAKIGGAVLPTPLGRFQDANGDGLDDYLVTASDRIDLYVGRGDGTFEAVSAIPYPFAGSALSDDLSLGDLDRDGLLDLVRAQQGTVTWYRGKAVGGFAPVGVTVDNPETLTTQVVVALADINGNGSEDVVWSSTSGMWRMDLAGATTAGMLVRAQNGLGMDTTIRYRSSHELSADARSLADPWSSELPISIPVPVEEITALGAGETTRRVQYGVRDGLWDTLERRFGGFLSTIVTTWGATPAETAVVLTRYHAGAGANRVLRGKPTSVQVKNGAGTRLSLTLSTWEAIPVAGLPGSSPLLKRAALREQRTRHEDTTPLRETRVTYAYDGLGRATRVVDEGRLDLDHDGLVRERRYADDDARWVRDVMCEDKVLSLAGAVATHTQHYFGDATTVAPLCVVGAGWPRETRGYLADADRWVTLTAQRYDAARNLTQIEGGGSVRELQYDAAGFVTEERLVRAPGDALVWQSTWDPVLGVPTAQTGPDGHVTRVAYDALGRPTSTSIDARPPHQVIAYAWTAPAPKTIVWDFDGALADVPAGTPAWSATGRWRQTIEVSNGRGELRYRARREAADRWIISDWQERDPASRVTFAGRPTYASAADPVTRPAGMLGDTLAYDPLGRTLSQRSPTGSARVYSYTAFERTTTEPALAPVHNVLDGHGRIVLTERTSPAGAREVIEARYDAAGRMTQMWLAGGVQRTFTYDTLGRLTRTQDPDLGARTLAYDDAGRLVEERNAAGQTVAYAYDALGRLVERAGGGTYRYHYDTPRPGASALATGVAGRVAWIEEPTGAIDLGYDELGRTRYLRRTIGDRSFEASTRYAASGLVLGRSYDDGFAISYQYDPAGRLVAAGDLWQALEQDASGALLHERFGNGAQARYRRDALGLASQVTVRGANGAALYDVEITRNAWQGITALVDVDGQGLDHGASFTYDAFARLTAATAAGGHQFTYGYDLLHNMTARGATGPSAIGAFAGTYRYGEAGRGPRQLTSIADAAGAPIHTFAYDAAGRQTAQDGLVLSYDPYDRLVGVTGHPVASLQHTYGHDGERVMTTAPGGAAYYFAPGAAERGGVREHDVAVGDRMVARVTLAPAGAEARVIAVGSARFVGLGLGLALLGFAATRRRGVRARVLAPALASLFASASCSTQTIAPRTAAWGTTAITYMHVGVGAGPVVFTDADGALVEERRYEPFGEELDARVRVGTDYVVGPPDLMARDLNALGKRTDATTGWSDHGARWLAPETARWLTPDPPLQGLASEAMEAPWMLHPYQYVDQNPIAYWDPDGNTPRSQIRFVTLGKSPRARGFEVNLATQRFTVLEPKKIAVTVERSLAGYVARGQMSRAQARAIAAHVVATLYNLQRGEDPGKVITSIEGFKSKRTVDMTVTTSRGSSQSEGQESSNSTSKSEGLAITGGAELELKIVTASAETEKTWEWGSESGTATSTERGTEEGTSSTEVVQFEVGTATLRGRVAFARRNKRGELEIVTVPVKVPRGTVQVRAVR